MTDFVGSSKADTLDSETRAIKGFTGGGIPELIDAVGDMIDARGGADLVYGGPGPDNINGGAGADSIDGGAGNDVIYGGGGSDSIDGGADLDVIYGGAGNDTLDCGTGPGGGLNQTIHGGAGDDVISSEGGYADLYGDAGNDTITAASFAGLVEGGAGADRLSADASVFAELSYRGSSAGVIVNLGTNSASGGDAEGDVISGFQEVAGSKFADRLIGTASHNDLKGQGGNDRLEGRGGEDDLQGGAGSDHLLGGAGNDTLDGGTGHDVLDGGAGTDLVTYADSPTRVVVNLATGATGAGAKGDSFISIENMDGSAYDDHLTGSGHGESLSGGDGNDIIAGGGGADHIDGGTGADTLHGGNGDDTIWASSDQGLYTPVSPDIYDGGAGFDEVNYDYYGAGDIALNLRTGKGTAGGADGDTLKSIEGIVTGTGNDLLRGSGHDETFDAGSGNDTVNSRGGADTFVVGAGDDTLNGGPGSDSLLFKFDITADLTVNLGQGTASGIADVANDQYKNIENVETGYTSHNCLLIGSGAANRFVASYGDDTLKGLGGNDWLDAGPGQNVLVGGAGNDRFVFSAQPFVDTPNDIRDLHSGDRIALSSDAFSAIGAQLTADEFHAGAAAQDANDRLIYKAGTHELFYDADGTGSHSQVLFAVVHGPGQVDFSTFLLV